MLLNKILLPCRLNRRLGLVFRHEARVVTARVEDEAGSLLKQINARLSNDLAEVLEKHENHIVRQRIELGDILLIFCL